jgi:hypothetical protein
MSSIQTPSGGGSGAAALIAGRISVVSTRNGVRRYDFKNLGPRNPYLIFNYFRALKCDFGSNICSANRGVKSPAPQASNA